MTERYQHVAGSNGNAGGTSTFPLIPRRVRLGAPCDFMDNWDAFWSKKTSLNFNPFLSFIHHKIVFHVYKKIMDNLKMKNPKIIELGCGTGELTIRMIKRYGGSATIVDKSEEALKIAKNKFKKQNIAVNILKKDLLEFKVDRKYDIVTSEGLIEHFRGKKLKKILDAHKKCVRKDGYILICVPSRRVWHYKVWRRVLSSIRKWPFGYERMIDKNELIGMLKSAKLNVLYSVEYGRYIFALAKI